MKGITWICALVVISIGICPAIAGCSGNNIYNIYNNYDPSVPEQHGKVAATGSHYTWGLWRFIADPQSETLEITRLRTGNIHLNALPFLEPPALVNLTIESLEFNGDIIEVDIGLRHPFLGLTEFTGFDVCGILISNGSITGFTDSDLRMTGDGDTRLLNPDGLTRWWNPSGFPVNNGTIFAYNDGLLGTPDSQADYNCTLNGYKYFCDDLGSDDPLDDVTPQNRGMFSAGQKNIRHYTIEMSGGLIFNYAIAASWQFPGGEAPWEAPEDFPPEANRPEAWRISITETENTLWNDGQGSGGWLYLLVDIYDWLDADLNTVRVESPGNFDMVESATPITTGDGYATYEIEIPEATPEEGEIELLISVVSEKMGYGGLLPGKDVTAYFTHAAGVSGEPVTLHKNIPLRDVVAVDIAIDHTTGDLLVVYNDNRIYKYDKDDYFETGNEFTVIPVNTATPHYIDIAPSGCFVVAVSYNSGAEIGAMIFDANGNYVHEILHHPDGPYDAHAFTAGSYQDDLGTILGVSGAASIITDAPRYPDGIWEPVAAYHDYYIYDSNTYGYDRVYYDFVKGVESDGGGNYLWFLEDPDYYASRWETYMVGTKGHLEYDDAYFGTGAQTDSDNGWNDAKDITRDNQNRYFVLDELSSGEPRIKMWTVSGNETSSAGSFGNSASISSTPLRIEGSDYDGDIVVLHGDTLPYMISVFTPGEMPGG